MKAAMQKFATALVAVALIFISTAGHANTVEESPSALAMTGDAIFARPVLLGMTVIGTGVFIVSLPFSLLGGNAGEAGEVLVMGPGKSTFVRCLGCTLSGRKASTVVTQEEQLAQAE